MVYYSLKDPLLWPGKKILLLAAGDWSNVDSHDIDITHWRVLFRPLTDGTICIVLEVRWAEGST